MINQLGIPTLFFTLSAVDIKWPDRQRLLIDDIPIELQTNKHRFDNIVNNPHMTLLYLHQGSQYFVKK